MVGSVSSQAMASACKVWKNFVFPPWAVLPVEELDFTEDDSDALLILLRIAHSDFANVPTTVSYTELLNLAVLCDQYDCIEMTKNWIEGWLEGETILSIKPGYENWLFIAWVFGRAKVFDDLAIHLVRTICIDEDGYCMNSQKKHLVGPFPPDIIGMFPSLTEHGSNANLNPESICDVRIEVLHQLWNPMHQDFNRYENRQGPICPYPGSRQNQLDCDAKIHNSCKFVLMMLGLSPQKPRCEIWYSFNELCERLRGITIERHDPSHFFLHIIYPKQFELYSESRQTLSRRTHEYPKSLLIV